MKAQAAVFYGPGEPLEVREIDLDEPGPRDVLVRMAAVGICGTDLHSIRGEWTRPTPMVLGHEGAGVVEVVGADVTSVQPGDEVVLSWAPTCGECADCRRGRPAACVNLHRAIGAGTLVDGTTGMSLDGETLYRGTVTGALTEQLVVTERAALPTGGGVPLEEAALLGCAALTGVGAVLFAARAEPGGVALVVGAGGVGQFCVQGARIAGAETIVCVDPLEARLKLVRELGATHVTAPAGLKELMAEVAPDGADDAFDTVGTPETTALALRFSAGRATRARDAVGLRALNEALRAAFDAPGSAGFARGGATAEKPPLEAPPAASPPPAGPHAAVPPMLDAAIRFKQSPVRLHPGERRAISLLFDPARVPPGTPIAVAADAGLTVTLRRDTVPEPDHRGWVSVSGRLRASTSVEPGSRLTVLAQAGDHAAELDVLMVGHTASGWVREIARKDEDALVEARFDPESGVVTVFEGRREFKALERAARRAGLPKQRLREYFPYRMLEVEVAANAVYAWAAERMLERRLVEERPTDPAEYASTVRLEAQALRHRSHERLMRAFLDPDVFEGGVTVGRRRRAGGAEQASLLDDRAEPHE